MKYAGTIWTYISGFVGGVSYMMFLLTHDPGCIVVGVCWIGLGVFARWINKKEF